MIDMLAYGPTFRQTSYAIIFPVVGAVLLALGIRRRLAWRRWNGDDNDRLLKQTPGSAAPGTDSEARADLGGPSSQPPGRGTALIVAGAIVAVLGAGHILSYVAAARVSNAVKYDVGQCITPSEFERRSITADPVDCGRTDATLQLISEVDADASCPDGKRDGTLYPALTSDVRTLCFVWNLQEGHCYAAARAFTPADCADPTANVKVARRVDGPGGAGDCPADGRAITYHEPKRSYCLVAP
ncbi:hypothetical protein CIW51_21935 [Mycolicibacterium sp. P9-22]|nr:hypothetical protein CIW51_21935 [Mycolicibacterium sp. P9-22]